jgi:hypothetical protein
MTSPRHMRLALTSSLAVIGLLTAGCANQVTAYRTQRIGPNGPMVITTDAYQRHLVMTPDADRAGMWRTCAEASPDVFSAISGSGAGDLGFNSTSTTGTVAQARAAMSIAQSAATAERTQTINLLRESMFRTCERYLNGAIDRTSFVVQAGRDWRAMIAILAIEQLTQVQRPLSTMISAAGTSATVIGGEDAQRELEAAEAQLETANDHLTEARALTCPTTPSTTGNQSGGEDEDEADDASDSTDADSTDADESASDDDSDNDSDNGDSGGDDASTDEDQPATTPPAADSGECDSKKTAIEEATTEVQQAEAAVAAARAKVNQAARSGAGTTAGTTNSAGGGGGSLTPAALRIIAPVVRDIVNRAFRTDETQLFCLQVLQDRDLPPQIRASCLRYLMVSIDQDTARLFSRPQVAETALVNEIQITDARTGLVALLSPLPQQDYERVRAELARRLPGFCNNLTKDACIQRIQNGAVDDPFSRDQVLSYLAEQATRRQQ